MGHVTPVDGKCRTYERGMTDVCITLWRVIFGAQIWMSHGTCRTHMREACQFCDVNAWLMSRTRMSHVAQKNDTNELQAFQSNWITNSDLFSATRDPLYQSTCHHCSFLTAYFLPQENHFTSLPAIIVRSWLSHFLSRSRCQAHTWCKFVSHSPSTSGAFSL